MIAKEGLEALARYAPVLAARDFRWGEWDVQPGRWPWMRHGDVASSFVDDAYRFGWVDGGFDWPEWAGSDEAARLRCDPQALAGANGDRLVMLLTWLIRTDRFCEGSLAAEYESGLLERIASRARVLAASMD